MGPHNRILGIAIVLSLSLLTYLPVAEGSTNGFAGFFRFRVHGTDWEPVVSSQAYFRDALVGGETSISGATDGESWAASTTLPDGTTIQWSPVTFVAKLGDQSNCFVAPFAWTICRTTSIEIIWYVTAQCQPTGLWKFSFTNNGSSFATPEFTLLPQIPGVLLLSQGGRTTAYNSICKGPNNTSVPCGPPYTTPWTIAAKGCALVDTAMVLGYHGVTAGADGNPVTPENLNAWLINTKDKGGNTGYTKQGDMRWHWLTKYSGGKVTYRGKTKTADDALLRRELCERGPTVIQVDSPGYPTRGKLMGHFAVATGRDHPAESTWLLNDPDGGVATTLTTKYSNRYYGLRKFTGPEFVWTDRLNGITIWLHSPAELLLTDPRRRRTGFEPITNATYNEIPESGYGETAIADVETGEPVPPVMELDIREPVDGSYTLQVAGTATGSYELEIDPQDKAGESPTTAAFENIPIAPGVVHRYTFDYSATPGAPFTLSGGFDGHGQRPSDVNRFLTYANPSEARTQLPPGETTFPLIIFYGTTILPQSFKAILNGLDITTQFTPTPWSHERISLSLASGSNTLVLAVDGTTTTGRVATDTDRLVFLVP